MPVKSLAAYRRVQFTRRERDFTYGVALKFLRDKEEARDVAQDALLLAFRYRHSFRGDSRFTTWLYRIAASAALMHLRRVRRHPFAWMMPLEDVVAPERECAGQPSPEELVSAEELLELCERIAAEMGTTYGPLVRLRFVDGCSQSEIAQQLGLELSTVRARTRRVVARMKEWLAKESDIPSSKLTAAAAR